MSQEQQAQELIYQMQMVEEYASQMAQREAALGAVVREAAAAIESARALEDGAEVQALAPLGLGAFARASMKPAAKIIVGIGAGIAVEKDRQSAVDYLESRLKEAEVAMRDAAARRQDAVARLEQGREQLGRLSAAAGRG